MRNNKRPQKGLGQTTGLSLHASRSAVKNPVNLCAGADTRSMATTPAQTSENGSTMFLCEISVQKLQKMWRLNVF